MRTAIWVMLAATSFSTGTALPAEVRSYELDVRVNLDDAKEVRLGATVPDETRHTLQIDDTRQLELRAFQHPPAEGAWHETRATLVDIADGNRRVLRNLQRNSNKGEALAGALSICGTRVIFINTAGAQPGRCAQLQPLSPPDPMPQGCGDCDGAYEGMPTSYSNRARIAPESEPGDPLRISGRVLGPDGKPRAGIIVYAYHTDRFGIYPPPSPPRAESHHQGTLRGWVRTGADGRYVFDTIRPASYPQTTVPQHVHMHVIEPGCFTYTIDELLFTDDPMYQRMSEAERKGLGPGMGGTAVVTPKQRGKLSEVTRDIHLGRNIRGYPDCVAPVRRPR